MIDKNRKITDSSEYKNWLKELKQKFNSYLARELKIKFVGHRRYWSRI